MESEEGRKRERDLRETGIDREREREKEREREREGEIERVSHRAAKKHRETLKESLSLPVVLHFFSHRVVPGKYKRLHVLWPRDPFSPRPASCGPDIGHTRNPSFFK
jgi:hypothetical protein